MVIHFAYGGMSGIRQVVIELINGLKLHGIDSIVYLYQRNTNYEATSKDFQDATDLIVTDKKGRFSIPQMIRVAVDISEREEATIIHHGPIPALIYSVVWRVRRKSGPRPILVHHQARQAVGRANHLLEYISSWMVAANVVVGANCIPKREPRFHSKLSDRVHKIPNPVGCRPTEPLPIEPRTAQPLLITMVGRMVPQKDFDTLITAAGIVFSQRPDLSFVLQIAGSGPDAHKVSNAMGMMPESTRVFLGELPFEESQALVAGSDIYVQSSNYEADLSTSVLVAMSHAVPVVAADCPGIREEVCGLSAMPLLLFPIGDAEKLASKLIELLSSPDSRKLLGDCGKQYVLENHSCPEVMSAWLPLLGEIL